MANNDDIRRITSQEMAKVKSEIQVAVKDYVNGIGQAMKVSMPSTVNMTEDAKKQAGIQVASMGDIKNEIKQLERVRNSKSAPSNLNRMSANEIVRVVDIENQYDKALAKINPNDKSKNRAVTYSYADYNKSTQKFDNAKYFYVELDDWQETVDLWYDFLTNFSGTLDDADDGESRKKIAQEMGFVDENGHALSKSAIGKIDKAEFGRFLDRMFADMGRRDVENPFTKKSTQGMSNVGRIRPEQMWNNLKKASTFVFNNTHDQYVIGNMAGKTKAEIDKLVVHDIKKFTWDKKANARLSRAAQYMGGMNAEIIEAFFGAFNEQAHNAQSDVASEGQLLVALDKSIDEAVDVLNNIADKAIADFTKENGYSPIDASGGISREHTAWFQGYLAKNADMVRGQLDNILTDNFSGALASSASPSAAADYHNTGFNAFRSGLSKSAQEYFSGKGLGKRLEANIKGIKAGTGDSRVGTSADRELASLFAWASQNGFVILYEKTGAGDKEEYEFYVVPQSLYNENDVAETKANAYNFSWIAPDSQGRLKAGNVGSTTQFFYDLDTGKYMDVNTWGLAKNVSAIKNYAGKKKGDQGYKTIQEVNNLIKAQSISTRQTAPTRWDGEKDYDTIDWDTRETDIDEAMVSQEELRRSNALMSWSAALSKYFERNIGARQQAASWIGEKDFKSWEVPEAIQNVLHRYLMEKTYNAKHYMEAIANSDDQLLKDFVSSPEFAGLLDNIDAYFNEGGGYYVHSLSHGSVGIGKAFANLDADLPFKDLLAMQSTASENTSKGKANSVNRKILSYEKLLKSGIWQKSSLREDGKNSSTLVTKSLALPKEILQAAVNKQWAGSKYVEGVTEERLFGDSEFSTSAKFYSNSKTDKVSYNDKGKLKVGKAFQTYLSKLNKDITDVNELTLNQTMHLNQDFSKATDRDLKLTNGLTIPKGSYVTRVTRTEKGLEVSYISASALRQGQKFVDTGTNQRHEYGYLRQENVIEAIQESDLPADEKELLIKNIQGTGAKGDTGIHTFMMDTPSNRGSSARVNGVFNEGFWEYLVNQIKTVEQFNEIASKVAGFGEHEIIDKNGKKQTIGGRYKWQEGKGVVSNLTLDGGEVSTLNNEAYFKNNSLWTEIDSKLKEAIRKTNKDISEEDINKLLPQYRASYSSNMSNVEFYNGEDIDAELVTLNSMYSDAWDIAAELGLVDEAMKGRLKLIAPNATTVAEYSGMAGLGYIDNGESRMRISTRMKENLRGRLEHLVASGDATQEQIDKYLDEYNSIYRGSDRAINKYNHTLAAMKGSKGKMADTTMFQAVFGNGSGNLRNGIGLNTNEIDITQADFGDLQRIGDTNDISDDDYKKSVIGFLYNTIAAAGYTLGENAQVQLSFAGLDDNTKAALNAVGFYDGQILALTPEEAAELNNEGISVRQASQQNSETLKYLRNALNIANGQKLEDSFAKNITNDSGRKKADAYYQGLQHARVKSGGDFYKEAVSDKIIATANLKVVALANTENETKLAKAVTELKEKQRLLAHTKDEAIQKQLQNEIDRLNTEINGTDKVKGLAQLVAEDEETSYGVISYQGAKDLLGYGNIPQEESVETVFLSVLADIRSRYNEFDVDSLESLKGFNFEDFDAMGKEDKKKTYTKLIESYIKALSESNMALPAWVLRNPLLNESNLLAGLKINTNTEGLSGEYTGQATNVLMLPEIVANLLNADFDGDMIQVCQSLIKDNTEIGNKLFKKILETGIKTRSALIAQGEWVDTGKTPEEFAKELIQQASVMSDPEFNSKFTISTMQGQEGLGLSSYLNTQTQSNLRAYRSINKDNGKQAVADEIFRTISSEMVEQSGISAKKILDKIVDPDKAEWDITTLEKLKDAVFNYTGTDEQKVLLNEYKIKDSNEKLQYIIQSVIDAYGEKTALESGILTKKAGENGQEYYGLTEDALIKMVTHAKLVNDQAAGKVEGLDARKNRSLRLEYEGAKRTDFHKINPELEDTPYARAQRYWKDYDTEGQSVDKLNGEYGEHAEVVDKAAQAEEAKLAASERLTKALKGEADTVAGVNDKVEDLIDTEKEAIKTAKEFAEGTFEYAAGGLEGIDNTDDGRKFRVGDKEYDQNSYDRVTELIGLNPNSDIDENIPEWEQKMLAQTSIKGTFGHKLMENMAITGDTTVEGMLESGSQFADEVKAAEAEMRSKLGVEATETLVEQYKKRAEAMAKAARAEGLLPKEGGVDAKNIEHTFAGKFANETRGISGQADVINDENYLIGDWKFSTDHSESTRMKRILQASAYAALHEEELIQQIGEEQKLLESADTEDKKAEIQARIDELESTLHNWEQKGQAKIITSDLDKDGNEFVEVVTADLVDRAAILEFLEKNQDLKRLLEEKAKYEAAIKNGAGAETQEKLQAVEKQLDDYVINNYDAAKFAKNARISIYDKEGRQATGFETADDYKKHGATSANKSVNAYLNNYKAQLKLQEDIQKQQQLIASTTGAERESHERILNAQQDKLSLLQSQAPVYNEQERTLGGILLTDQQIKKLEDGRAVADKQHLINQQMISAQMKQQKGFLQKIVGGFKNQITMFIDTSLAYQAIGRVRSSIRELIQLTEELDKQLVNIQIATGYSRTKVHDLLLDYNKLASELGRTTSAVAEAANDWLRAGYEGEEAAELTRASMMLSTLGLIDASDATTYLVSTLKGWKLEANEVISVVDKLSAVDMSAAISAGDLALAMSRANNSARLAGVEMNNFIGYVTTVADVSQKSAESVGESFKTIFSRFGNVKAGKFAATDLEASSESYDEAEYENLNDIETVLSKVNIKVRENATTWRDIDDVLTDIGDKWKSWDQTTKNAVATAVAGTRQRENVITLFENWEDVQKYAEIAENSYGTATEKMAAYTESVEASKQRLTNAVERWALWFDNSDFIKAFYDDLSFVTENLHIFGTALVAYAAITNIGSIIQTLSSGLTKLAMKLYDFSDAFTITKTQSGFGAAVKQTYAGAKTTLQDYANLAESQIYADSLTQYTAVLGEETVLRLNTIQQLGLGLDAENKRQLATVLETAAVEGLTQSQYNGLSEETRLALAKALLTNATNAQTRQVLEDIISKENVYNTQQQTNAVLEEFNLQTQNASLAMKKIANNLNSSANSNATAKMTTGLSSVVGMMGGGIIGSTLTSELGGTAQSIGMLLGSTVGQYAAKSATTAITGAIAAKGGLTAVLTGLGTTGVGAIAAVVIGGIVAVYKSFKKKALKALQEDFKEAQTYFSSIQTSGSIAKEYDKLAAGVDKYGNNIALTDEEYEKFLEDGNKLAELFPEMISYTDEEGNNFVGLGNAIGGVTEEIERLIKAQQDLVDSELFREDEYGQSNFESNRSEIQSQMEEAVQPFDYRLKNNGAMTTLDVDYLKRKGKTDEVLAMIHEIYESGNEQIRAEIEQWEDEGFDLGNINMLQGFGAELKTMMDSSGRNTAQIVKASASELDEYKAYLRTMGKSNSELQELLDDANSEDYMFINNALKNINNYATEFDADAVLGRVEDFGGKLPALLSDLKSQKYGDFSLFDIMMGNIDDYDSIEQMDEARQALLNYFADTFGADGMYDETEKAIMFSVGFEVNDNNVIEDTENVLTNLRDLGIKESNGDNVSIENIKALNPEDAKTVTKWIGEGKVNGDTSMRAIVEMLHADRAMPTTLEGMASYIDERAAALAKTETSLNSLLDSDINTIKNNFKDLDINEAFADAPETVRESLKELRDEVLEGGLSAEDVKEKVNDIINTEMVAIEAGEAEIAEAMIKSFFPADLEIDGYIDTFKELKTALDSLVESYEALTNAQKEQNTKGRLSLNTWTQLLAADENYIKVLDFEKDAITGKITKVKLAEDANKIYAFTQLQVVRASAQVAVADKKAAIVRTQKALDDVKAAKASLEADNKASEGLVENSNQVVEGLALRIRVMNQMGAAFAAIAAGVKAVVEGGNFSDAWQTAKDTYSKTITEENPEYSWRVTYKGYNLEKLNEEESKLTAQLQEQQDEMSSWQALLDSTADVTKDNIDEWLEDEELVEDETANLTSQLEALKNVISALNLEYQQMIAHNELGIKGMKQTADYLASSYYDAKEKYINKALAIAETKLEGATLDDILALYAVGSEEANEKADELLGYYNDIQDLYVQRENLNDEEIQNRLDMLTVMGDITDEQIKWLKAKIDTADSAQEELEYIKAYNDAVREQIKLKKEVAEYEKKLADYQLEYLEGQATLKDGSVNEAYEAAIDKAETALENAIAQSKKLVETTYQQLYDYYMSLGIYTSSEASALAKESEEYRDAVTQYIEAQKALGDLYMDDFENKVGTLERRMKELETSKPNDWASDWNYDTNSLETNGKTAIDKIKAYYGQAMKDVDKTYIASLTDEKLKELKGINGYYVKIAKEAYDTLTEYSGKLTDEQVETLTEKYNDAMKNIRDTSVSMLEDIKEYQESVYSALTDEIERYKDQLEEQKEIVEDYYDKEIDKLNDKNEAIERTNKLLELQQNLLNAQDEKSRVFRQGE